MTKLIKYQLFNLIGILNAGTFLVLAILLLLPIVSNGANAEDEVSDNTTMRMEIVANPVVSIALDDSVGMEFTPKAAGAFDSKSARLVINTNNISGYRIIMSTEGTTNDLTNIDDAGIIKSISGQVSASAFPNNTWGYNITQNGESLDLYNAIPNTDTEIKNVQHEVMVDQADIYSLNFGAKVSSSIPAGTYSKQVIVSAVANPIMKNNMMHLDYMQEMTNEYCKNTRGTDGSATVTPGNEPSKQLIDIRDGKKYWVSKLADQNCWMTQNLDLDITQTMINDGSLNSSNTDLGAGQVWGKDGLADSGGNLISNYAAVPTEKGIPISDPTMLDPAGWAATKSWDLGQYILLDPQNTNGCSGVSAAAGVASCNRVQLVNENTNYDSHYLIGNRYQYNTATAGTAGEAIDIEAPNSICAKGWKLPSSKSTTRSFTNLINSYTQDYLEHNPTPFYFVGAGNINTYSGYLDGIGSYGNYWSSTVGSDKQYAEYLLTTGTVTGVVYNDGRRYFGISIRCEAR